MVKPKVKGGGQWPWAGPACGERGTPRGLSSDSRGGRRAGWGAESLFGTGAGMRSRMTKRNLRSAKLDLVLVFGSLQRPLRSAVVAVFPQRRSRGWGLPLHGGLCCAARRLCSLPPALGCGIASRAGLADPPSSNVRSTYLEEGPGTSGGQAEPQASGFLVPRLPLQAPEFTLTQR